MSDWKILDCTLRDGGYYTNWDFPRPLVERYLKAIASLPVSFVELGYRAKPESSYFGAYYYLPRYLLEWCRSVVPDGPDFAIMLNAKDCVPEQIPSLLAECKGLVRLVRMAVDPQKLDHALALAKAIKEQGFEVALNLMYLSKSYDKRPVLEKVAQSESIVDYLALVDSFGACFPEQVSAATKVAKEVLSIPVGFHGHDNATLAFANSLAALSAGADMIDATVTGMGRGAGNLRTEVIASYLKSQKGERLQFTESSRTIEEFESMKMRYGWGAQFPYVVAGLSNLPQADVMSWLAQDRYSLSSIIDALSKTAHEASNAKAFTPLKEGAKAGRTCVIVGGGPSVIAHQEAIAQVIARDKADVIFSSCRHLAALSDKAHEAALCLVGDEFDKMADFDLSEHPQLKSLWIDSKSYVGLPNSSGIAAMVRDAGCIAPADRKDAVLGSATPLGVALAGAKTGGYQTVYLVGFDGYASGGAKATALSHETQEVLSTFLADKSAPELISLTESLYQVPQRSIYGLLARS